MGLIKPIAVPTSDQLGSVHFVAVGGSGMNGIATVFLELGAQVSGSDRQDSEYLQALRQRGATVYVGHRAEQLGQADTVVVSSAVRPDNPELAEARRRGLRVVHRSAALGSLMQNRRGVAVAGTHGKTTTTAMLATVLAGGGLDPSYVIGGALTGSKTGGHLGAGDLLVVEADESDGSFLQYPAEVAVVTNIDPDHLVNWGTPAHYAEGFWRFATAGPVRLLVISADDPGGVALTARLRDQAAAGGSVPQVVTFGTTPGADVRVSSLTFAGTGVRFTLQAGGGHPEPVTLSVPGSYNALNAAATYAVATDLGMSAEAVCHELGGYRGTYRRFQLVGEVDGVRVYDDYAHHPTEVANTLRAARTGAGAGRVVVCFQPHLYTRTQAFWRELAAALELADEVVVMDVCGDREDPIVGVDGRLVSDAITPGTATVTYEPVWDAAPGVVAAIAQPGDLVITVGCGDVTKIAPRIVAELADRSGGPR